MPKKEEIVMRSSDYIGGFKTEEQEPRKLTAYQELRLQHQLNQDNHYLMTRGLKFASRITVPLISRMQIKRASTAFRNLAKQLDKVLANKEWNDHQKLFQAQMHVTSTSQHLKREAGLDPDGSWKGIK
tara:strand:- start:517 stop:900 length:384 start_codon:yes stop_codon:yes gene_type:complete